MFLEPVCVTKYHIDNCIKPVVDSDMGNHYE